MNSKCETLNIQTLFTKKLHIPDYQRPYAWKSEQVIALIDDLIEAFENKKDNYLIGNMIWHVESEVVAIVDGQQRVTTLALILKVLNEEVDFLEEEVNALSIKSIQKNYKLIENRLKNYSKVNDFKSFIKSKVIITIVNANDLDEAFILFDSQNTRGKPLSRKDLLKVHHLRFVVDYLTQKILAKKWEDITIKENENIDFDDIDELLYLLAFGRKTSRGELKADDLI